jgi:hypothetical protein
MIVALFGGTTRSFIVVLAFKESMISSNLVEQRPKCGSSVRGSQTVKFSGRMGHSDRLPKQSSLLGHWGIGGLRLPACSTYKNCQRNYYLRNLNRPFAVCRGVQHPALLHTIRVKFVNKKCQQVSLVLFF